MKKTFAEHLDPNNGPKNILSLDGGGIRGALTLGYLKKIETILRTKYDDPNLRMSDYFDLIGGTSTGSIIATGLAIGKEVDELVELYMELGGKIFGKKRSFWKPWETWKFLQATYDYTALQESLKSAFKDITIGGEEVLTGLCIVAKRGDTNSTWPIINHPNGKFYDSKDGRNKDIPLWKAVRASSAAPTYFVPQMIDVGGGQKAAFVDGGVSMANNPSLTLLMVATLKGFPFHWKMGEDQLSITSVGTGYSIFSKKTSEIEESWMADWAKNVPNMLMQDASWQNQIVMQWLSNSPTAVEVDMEIGKLDGDYFGGKPLIKYNRYNIALTQENLNSMNLNKSFSQEEVESIIEMSNAENRHILYDIGVAASTAIEFDHFG